MAYHNKQAIYHLQQAFNHVSGAETALNKMSKRPTIAHYILEAKKNIKALLDMDFDHIKQHEERKKQSEIHQM